MKRFLLLNVIGILLVSGAFGATIPRAILSHNGVLTQYDYDHYHDAFTDAVDGDIIYLTPGTFYGDISITKSITVIGAGVAETDAFYYGTNIADAYAGCGKTGESTTLCLQRIDLAVSGTSPSSIVLEGLKIVQRDNWPPGIRVSQNLTNLTIKRCQINFDLGVDDGYILTNLRLESTFLTTIRCARITTPSIYKCYIENFVGEGISDVTITNCMINNIDADNCHFLNCGTWGYPWEHTNTYVNCIYASANAVSAYNNCWQNSSPAVLTKTQLQTLGYLGDDNNVVGPLGGTDAFTLITSQPYVASSALNYNATTKKLNVTMTINKGE